MAAARSAAGRAGEAAAAAHLEATGYTIEARNWGCAGGELDLVARRGEVLVFVEVRSVTTRYLDSPLRTIVGPKQRRVAVAADAYIRATGAIYRDLRFDVVGVHLRADAAPEILHIENAFVPPWAY